MICNNGFKKKHGNLRSSQGWFTSLVQRDKPMAGPIGKCERRGKRKKSYHGKEEDYMK